MRNAHRTAAASAILCLLSTGYPLAEASSAPRERNESRGSCDGILDYADELRPDQVELARQTDLGGGLAQVELSMQIVNTDLARFRSASAFVRVEEGNPLGILANATPVPADFGAIDPFGSAPSAAALQLQLPAANVPDLVQQIEDGTLPVTVHADEEAVYPPGTLIRTWTRVWDSLARNDEGGPLLPGEPSTDEPGAVHFVEFGTEGPSRWTPGPGDVPTYAGDASGGHPPFDAGEALPGSSPPPPAGCFVIDDDARVYLTPGEDVLWTIPRWLHYVRLHSICPGRDKRTGNPTIGLWVEPTTHDSLPEVVESGSFCLSEEQQVGEPVAATRVHALDGQPLPPQSRDENGQPIRFNYLPWWGAGRFALSGQVGCDTLKPQVSFRIRDGRVESGFGFDTACSVTAEMRVYEDVEVEEYQEPIEMWSHCFALPPLNLGTASIPMTLQLKHLIDVTASASAGAVVGFTKRWEAGFSASCEAGAGAPASCTTEKHREPTPLEFTPPQLTDQSNVSMQAKTTFEAALRMGFEYPLCEFGAGVTLESNAYATAAITPAVDPWWRTTYGLDLVGGVDFGFYALGLVDLETDLFVVEDGIDAGGPLLGGVLGGAALRSAAGGIAARGLADPLVAGADQRWAVAIDDVALPNGVDVTGVAALPDGSAFAIASEAVGGRSALVKLDRFGALQWVKRLALGKTLRRVRALSDGTAVTASSNAYLARHDADGNVLWSFDGNVGRPEATFARCSLRDVVPIEQSPGVYDYVVVGIMGQSTIAGSNDACAFRVNADGSVPWSKIYGADDVQYFHGATATRDGDVAVVGEVHGQLAGNRRFPLLAKLDAATGDVIWWRALPMLRTARLNAVAEAPDGTLFGVGVAYRTILQTASALVARIDADGGNPHHGLLFQDSTWESLFAFDTWTPTAGGDSPYDEFFDIAPMGDGFAIAGRTGLGTSTAGWVARIDQNLAPLWYRVFDGAGLDSLGGVAPTTDGIFISGYSGSLPEPDGPNTGENQLWVMKLPFTGAVELVPDAGVTTRYLATGLRFSSEDPAVSGSGVPVSDGFTVSDAVVVSSGPNPGIVTTTTTYCAVLLTESGHESTLDACAESAEPDADGVANDGDNCPSFANADQADTGGIGSGSAPDGIGDACQCGDVSGDGRVTLADAVILQRSLLQPPTATLTRPELCDVGGGGAECTLADAVILRRALLQPPTTAIGQVCAPATP